MNCLLIILTFLTLHLGGNEATNATGLHPAVLDKLAEGDPERRQAPAVQDSAIVNLTENKQPTDLMLNTQV